MSFKDKIGVVKSKKSIYSKLLKVSKKKLESSELIVVEYTKFKNDNGFANFETKEEIKIEVDGAFVYAIYELDDKSNIKELKYIGSSKSVTARLKKHLVKNDDAKLDGTFVANSGKIANRSKIAKVYELLKDKEKKEIGLKIIKIEDEKLYTAIESLLIEEYGLTESGWNIKK